MKENTDSNGRTSLTLMAATLALGVWMAHAAPSAAGQNWPQWRGPLASGAAPDANPPLTWSEEKNVKWKVKIPGRGTATPIVWGQQVFTQTAIATNQPGDPREFVTPFGLNQPGARVALKVFVILTTGNEAGSGAMLVQRPAGVQLAA